MQSNIYDRVLSRMTEIIDKTSYNISDKFKGANPFDKQKVPMDEQIVQYKTMNSKEAQDMIKQYGADEVERWMAKVEQAIQRRGLNA